jgi:hypothetical protein
MPALTGNPLLAPAGISPAGLQDSFLLVIEQRTMNSLIELTQVTSQEPISIGSLRRDQAFELGVTPPAPTGNR